LLSPAHAIKHFSFVLLMGLSACSEGRPAPANMSNDTAPTTARYRLMTFKSGFPAPAAIDSGTFGISNDCLALRRDGSTEWLVAVVPPGSTFSTGENGAVDGVVVEGVSARFGTRVRFGGGVSPYDLGPAGRSCPGKTIIIGSLLP